jgi:hypothetical protein
MKFIKVATGETSSEIPTQLRQVRHSLRVTKLLDEGENATIPHFYLHSMQGLIRHLPAVFANFASPTGCFCKRQRKNAQRGYTQARILAYEKGSINRYPPLEKSR